MADVLPFDQRDGSLWFDGHLVPWKQANIHVLTHGLHYGSCVFEGERMYNGRIYKLEEHTQRLFDSARLMGMTIPYTPAEIEKASYRGHRESGLARRLCPPRGVARQRDDGRRRPALQDSCRHRRLGLAVHVRSGREAERHPPGHLDLEAPRAGYGADAGKGRRPLHDLHALQARGRGQGLCRCDDVRLSRLCRRGDGREHLLRQGRQAASRPLRTVFSTASRANR